MSAPYYQDDLVTLYHGDALGRLITLTIALTLIATGIATADGTILPAVAWITGLGLTLRVLHVAASKENQS